MTHPTDATAPLPSGWADHLPEADRSVVRAVATASRLLRAMQPRVVAVASSTSWKADGTPVTAADVASQATIVEAIERSSRDAYRLFAEENGTDTGTGGDTVWFVDPLDGTNGYRRGSTDYAILVSRWRAGRPEFSVVHYPAFDAWLVVTAAGLHHAGSVTAVPGTPHRSCLCYFDQPAEADFRAVISDVPFVTSEETGTALCGLALGEVDAVAIQVRRLKAWDVAPLVHAVETSGGRILDEHGERLALSGPRLTARFILAARREHDLNRLVAAAGRACARPPR